MVSLKAYFTPVAKEQKDAEKDGAITVMDEKAAAGGQLSTTPAGYATPGTRRPSAFSVGGLGAQTPGSIYPVGDFRNAGLDEIMDIKCDVMINWMYQQQMELLWTAGGHDEGVILKKSRGTYTCCPSDIIDEPFGFFASIRALNVRVSENYQALTHSHQS